MTPFAAQVLQASAELVDRFWSDEPVDEWDGEVTKVEPYQSIASVNAEWRARQAAQVERMHDASEGALRCSRSRDAGPCDIDGANEAAPDDGFRLVGQAAHLCGDPDHAGWEVGAISMEVSP